MPPSRKAATTQQRLSSSTAPVGCVFHGSRSDCLQSAYAQFRDGIYRMPIVFGVCGYDPPMQFLHEDDIQRLLA